MKTETIPLTPFPEGVGLVVSMIEFDGTLYVATQGGVFVMNGDGDLEPVYFVDKGAPKLEDEPR